MVALLRLLPRFVISKTNLVLSASPPFSLQGEPQVGVGGADSSDISHFL
jgi:hypothetical protein